jgi:ABC-type polar amino acid transport system, ATPase component
MNDLERPDGGTITIDVFSVEGKHASKKVILTLRRKTAMVFQHNNLFKKIRRCWKT